MVQQKRAAARRRPLSREEALARQERQQRRREMEEESRELAKGPIDLPFFILVLLLTGIGLVMLLSASFPSAYYETDGQNPLYYFIRQGVFAIMGVAAMLFIGKINYQRFRGLAKPLLYLSVILLVLVVDPGEPPGHHPEQRHPLAGHPRHLPAVPALGDRQAGGGHLLRRQHLQKEGPDAHLPLRHRCPTP